jgi:hypothetical protein
VGTSQTEATRICIKLTVTSQLTDITFGGEEGMNVYFTLKKNFVALVRKRTIPTGQPPRVGEVSANYCG